MVATLAQAASAAYYLESQRSFRHPNEYYTAGEEPDGVWFNPADLFGLEDGGRVDSGEFHRLYHGSAPDGSGKLTRNAGSERRSPGLDMTFSADKSVSALWAIADPDLRGEIERAHNGAARVALEETVFRHCGWTRIRNADGRIEVLPADIAAAMFQHGTSRDNDPQLHTHCVIFNAAGTHEDGKWRAMHQHPVYGWAKAAGAVYRNALAWNLHRRLGLPVEQYGRDGEFTRIVGVPEDLAAHWSKRRAAIVDAAHDMGFRVEGNAARAAAANKITRAGKSPDNDPEVRHGRWRGEAEGFCEREVLIAELPGKAEDITQEQIRELTAALEVLPERLTREEAVFRLPDIVERVSNATAGLLGREAAATAIERVMRHPEVVRLSRIPRSAEGRADMAHTRLYTTGRTLEMELAVREMAAGMAADSGHALPAQAIEDKLATLLEKGYPLSGEQAEAIRAVAGARGRVAIVQGAAGSGKTTTLRPIADLYREDGKTIVATAVAWRTAVALGNDLDARPFCVDKLLKLAARGTIEIDENSVVVVDEAGMLSTRQAHHILRLADRHGARVVFAGDTRQQQPVEAGPGLRLIRDAVGSVRVDRIRRQKADLEDILVHVHGETPQAARFRAGLMGEEERARILSDYEAMEDKPAFTPWQVAVSEALRDGDAAQAIQAWHERGRFHLGYNEERTLRALVDDWERYTREHPEKSSVVLVRTRAEARALSHLMRERRFARRSAADDAAAKAVTVHVSRGTEDDRTASPLEIAVGDRLRIGATRWEKQLFNGTVVTVEELKILRHEVGTGADGPGPGEAGGESPVLIAARTDDGRRVSFRHDEIRDWYGNIRLDHGYAMTIAAAQGMTVDKTFLLVDDRPARETIYPAATRHREEIDIYVNRAPLALDVADRRADSDRDAPVLDSEIRAHLAERWSRSVPKEAALDYMGVGDWEDRREDIGARRRSAGDRRHDVPDEALAAANDNALTRIARDVRRTAFAWRHGAAVDAFAAGRHEVLASWDELRARTRADGDAVALGDTYRETLHRHAALLRQAEPFRAHPEAFASLLTQRAGIGRGDLEAFEALHNRARRHRRAATMRQMHRTTQEAQPPDLGPEMRQGELALEGGRGEAPAKVQAPATNIAATPSPDRGQTPVARVPTPPPPEPRKPAWQAAYDPVAREWNALVERARQSGTLPFYAGGYTELIPRIRALAENPDVPSERRAPIARTLQDHERHLAARKKVEDFLAAAGRHRERRDALRDAAVAANLPVTEAPSYPRWRRKAERLMENGKAILSDRERYGPHLDNIDAGEERARGAVSGLGEAIRADDEQLALAERKAREQRLLARASARLMFAVDSQVDAAEADPALEAPARAALSRLGHAVGRLVGGADYEDRVRTETYRREALERSEQAMRQWNRQVGRAVEEGVHVIHTDGYDRLRKELDAVSRNFLLDRDIAGNIGAVLSRLDEAKTNARFVESWHGSILKSLERREALEASAAGRGVAVCDLADYDRWRNMTDEEVDRGEYILAHPEDYAIYLHGAAGGRESLASGVARVRTMSREDDRQLAETQAGRREGEDARAREERVARILDDPVKLRELRMQRAERGAGEEQRKGRYQSRGMSI